MGTPAEWLQRRETYFNDPFCVCVGGGVEVAFEKLSL